MRNIIKIIKFVLDELYTNDNIIKYQNTENTSHNFAKYDKLIQCFMKFVKMYIISRKQCIKFICTMCTYAYFFLCIIF